MVTELKTYHRAALARTQHKTWFKSQWEYGQRFPKSDVIHPLLRREDWQGLRTVLTLRAARHFHISTTQALCRDCVKRWFGNEVWDTENTLIMIREVETMALVVSGSLEGLPRSNNST